jgi:hypothetical protein
MVLNGPLYCGSRIEGSPESKSADSPLLIYDLVRGAGIAEFWILDSGCP